MLWKAVVICCATGKLCSKGWLFWQWILAHSVKNVSSVRLLFTKENYFAEYILNILVRRIRKSTTRLERWLGG